MIVGVAESDLGTTGLSMLGLQAQALSRALDDCGLGWADIDGLASNGASRWGASTPAEYFGIYPRWIDTTFAGGASYEIFAGHAAQAIRSGRAEVIAIVYGSNQRSARRRRLAGAADPETPESQFEAPYAPLSPISAYALAAQRHMHEFGTTAEQMAEVAVAARAWALLNPVAFHHRSGPIQVADVLASPIISSPLRQLDCCLVTDGGGAVVMTTLERARDLRRQPVRVLGHGEYSTHVSIAANPDLTATGGYLSARRAYAEAGLGPPDIDVVQIYDSFTITVLLTLEALGFCERGESGRFVADGRLRPGGAFPINTSGGGLSYCHPGMFGIFLLIEAVRQLRGECGDRQLARHQTAICHGTGGILSTHGTVILGIA